MRAFSTTKSEDQHTKKSVIILMNEQTTVARIYNRHGVTVITGTNNQVSSVFAVMVNDTHSSMQKK
jgi:hypothetical protein